VRWLRRPGAGRGLPRSVGVAVRRALLAVLDRDLPAAERLLSRAVRLDSEDVLAYLALARVYRQRGEIGRAIHLHQNLLLRSELDEAQRQEVLLELGADFRQGGFLRRAISAYEDVLARDGRSREALAALARLYREVRQLEEALEMEGRRARAEGRDAGPVEAELWVEIAEAARGEKRLRDARKALKRALRRDAGCVAAWIALGEVEAARGRERAARRAWQQVPRLQRRSGPAVYPRLEASFAAAGESERHEAFLRELLATDPDDAGARLALARALAARGEAEEAVAEVRRLLERQPDHREGHATLARILLAEHRDAEAAKAYGEFLDVLERSGGLHSPESSE